jgi:hypothetical protein
MDKLNLGFIFYTLIFFFLSVFLHCISIRIFNKINIFYLYIVIGTFTGMALISYQYSASINYIEIISSITLFALLSELYIFIFTLVISSVTVQILISMIAGPQDISTVKNDDLYDEMVQLRVARLIKNQFLILSNDSLIITNRGLRLIRFFNWLKSVFKHNSS